MDWTHEILEEGVATAQAFLLRHFKLAENVPPRFVTSSSSLLFSSLELSDTTIYAP